MFSLKLILKIIQFRPTFSIPLVFSEVFCFCFKDFKDRASKQMSERAQAETEAEGKGQGETALSGAQYGVQSHIPKIMI